MGRTRRRAPDATRFRNAEEPRFACMASAQRKSLTNYGTVEMGISLFRPLIELNPKPQEKMPLRNAAASKVGRSPAAPDVKRSLQRTKVTSDARFRRAAAYFGRNMTFMHSKRVCDDASNSRCSQMQFSRIIGLSLMLRPFWADSQKWD